MSFQVLHEKTKIFGCQNPFRQGGGRKGLPRSFLNRFTQVRFSVAPETKGGVGAIILLTHSYEGAHSENETGSV